MQIQEQIDNRQGKSQILSNIKLLTNLSTYLRTTLGPYGLDKLIVNSTGMLITNDGATIMKNLKLQHPAAKLLESISIAQDEEVGDGTTSVVLLTVEILKCFETIIRNDDVGVVVGSLDDILEYCLSKLDEYSFELEENKNNNNKNVDNKNKNIIGGVEIKKPSLCLLASTALTSKILKHDKLSNLIVDSLKKTPEISIKKIRGGTFSDSYVFKGIAFEKCFTYAGYEQQPKKISRARILLTNVELEWKSERENAEVRIGSVEEYQNVVDAEWRIIKDKLDFAVECGANVVLSSAPIGDYATQYFARFGIFCAGRVNCDEIRKVRKFCGGRILSSMNKKNLKKNNLFIIKKNHNEDEDENYNERNYDNNNESDNESNKRGENEDNVGYNESKYEFKKFYIENSEEDVIDKENYIIRNKDNLKNSINDFFNYRNKYSFLAHCTSFEEKQIGNTRYNFITSNKGSTIILRGPGDEILNEMERSLNDALMVVKKNMKKDARVVTGGGSVEMLLSIELKKMAMGDGTKRMFVYLAIAQAFENMVSILIGNFGMDTLNVFAKMKRMINQGERFCGIVKSGVMVQDMRIEGVYEPFDVKKNILIGAFNAVKTILSIDSTIIVPSKQ